MNKEKMGSKVDYETNLLIMEDYHIEDGVDKDDDGEIQGTPMAASGNANTFKNVVEQFEIEEYKEANMLAKDIP